LWDPSATLRMTSGCSFVLQTLFSLSFRPTWRNLATLVAFRRSFTTLSSRCLWQRFLDYVKALKCLRYDEMTRLKAFYNDKKWSKAHNPHPYPSPFIKGEGKWAWSFRLWAGGRGIIVILSAPPSRHSEASPKNLKELLGL
jgi:hypothetical protein